MKGTLDIMSDTDSIPFSEAQQRLKAEDLVFTGILNAGLLGYGGPDGHVSRAALESFERYGTQWHHDVRRTVPRSPGMTDQFPDTQIRTQIAPAGRNLLALASHDVGWIAQFYLQANPCFWPTPGVVTPAVPLPLKFPESGEVLGAEKKTYLYPAPDGTLGMVMVIGLPAETATAFEAAYAIANPILDELSVRFDVPLPIVQSVVIGIPSGVARVSFPQPPGEVTLHVGDHILPRYEFPELADAVALYREGVSSNSPYHKFLTLWRARENALRVRARCRKRSPRVNLRPPTPEVFPREFLFDRFGGLRFGDVIPELNQSYRVALAHGDVDGGRPRSGAVVEDLNAVSHMVPVIRYMARVTIENTRTMLRAAAAMEAK